MTLNAGQIAQTQTAYTLDGDTESISVAWGTGTVTFGVHDLNQVLSAQSNSSLTLYDNNSGAFGDRFEAVSFEQNGTAFIALSPSSGTGIATFEVAPNGTLSPVDTVTGTDGGFADSAAGLSIVRVDGNDFLVSVSATDDSITSFAIQPDGGLIHTETMGVENYLPVATPQDVASLSVAGQTYVVMASADTSSLTVFSMSSTGNLTAVDQVMDDLSTRLQGAQVVETFTVGDRGFVLAAGQDSGISLFGVLPDGQLLHLDTVIDQVNFPIDTITDMHVAEVDGSYQLFTISASEAGMGQFALNLDQLGVTTTIDADGVTGTDLEDLLTADSEGRAVFAYDGNDILKDGGGSDTLAGGNGNDIFILTADGTTDTISDFDPGRDTLDLSGLTFFRDVSQLDIQSTSSGAQITFRDEIIIVNSAHGGPLSEDDFTNVNTINATHVDTSFVFEDFQDAPAATIEDIVSQFNVGSAPVENDRIDGTKYDDHLTGTDLAQTLNGGNGQDLLRGGGGADALNGGNGIDVADYANASAGVEADLADPSANTGDAQGDSYTKIEGIGGSAWDDILGGDADRNVLFGEDGDDVLRGQAGGDRLFGGDGIDWMDGGQGDDYLSGDAGNDALLGRVGDDVIYGGEGNDNIAAHAGNDLVYGGAGDDQMGGSDGDDRMFGGSGHDVIGSGAQTDYIHTGQGNDVASGGWGADEVHGGSGADTLAGSFGDDLVTGGDGDDDLGGGQGTDAIYAGNGNDAIGAGHDDDFAFGGAGDDFIGGGDGNDFIDAGSGDDKINAGAGNDTIYGGPGTDTYVFNSFSAGEVDVIMDFDTTQDIIRMRAVDGRYSALEVSSVQIDGRDYTDIRYDGHTIRLADTDANSLTPDDFVFIG